MGIVTGGANTLSSLGLANPEQILREILAQKTPDSQSIIMDIPQIRTRVPLSQFIDVDHAQSRNTVGHTFDDALLVDGTNGIHIVADGVTREFCKDQDAAWRVAKAFCRLMHFHMCQELARSNDPRDILYEAFKRANEGINELNQRMGLGKNFLEDAPGSCTTSIVFAHAEDFYTAVMGDAGTTAGDLTTRNQTSASERLRNKIKDRRHKLNLHRRLANSMQFKRISYGVVNGHKDAPHFLDIQTIQHKGTIELYTDGYYNAVGLAKFPAFIAHPDREKETVSQTIGKAVAIDSLKQNKSGDDISVIRIKSKH